VKFEKGQQQNKQRNIFLPFIFFIKKTTKYVLNDLFISLSISEEEKILYKKKKWSNNNIVKRINHHTYS